MQVYTVQNDKPKAQINPKNWKVLYVV